VSQRAKGPLSGILLIDKPEQMTSARVVDRVKRALRARKVGHAGTLDPFATGLLICCIDQATRLARFFMQSDKTYQGTLHLGVTTDTGDATGKVISEYSGKPISEERIRSVFRRFRGRIPQVPPAYSALKHRGIPLYRWARQGKTIQKPPRTVVIHRLTVNAVDFPKVFFETTCSAGTYIRSLAVDAGAALECGGHLARLRRIQSGAFHVKEALPLDRLDALSAVNDLEEKIIPMAAALRGWPELAVGDTVVEKLRHGRPLVAGDIPETPAGTSGRDQNRCIKVIDAHGALIALLHPTEEGGYGYYGVFNPSSITEMGS
jgi:tRNA pseudouridine55 synthase